MIQHSRAIVHVWLVRIIRYSEGRSEFGVLGSRRREVPEVCPVLSHEVIVFVPVAVSTDARHIVGVSLGHQDHDRVVTVPRHSDTALGLQLDEAAAEKDVQIIVDVADWKIIFLAVNLEVLLKCK